MTHSRSVRLCAVAAAALLLSIAPRAQQPSTPYPLLASGAAVSDLLAAWNGSSRSLAGELIVRFKDGVPASGQARALSVLRGRPSHVRTIGDAVIVAAPAETNAEAAAAALARQPEVDWAQPNYVRRMTSTPNDPAYNRQWNFDLLGLPRAWDINSGATGTIIVAVVDTGVTTVNSDFTFRLWTGSQFENVTIPFRVNPDIAASRILPGRDFVLWNGPVLDMQGHGTHVAGTVLQETNNSVGLAGIAYRAMLLPVKACYSFWDIQILLAANNTPGYVNPDLDGVCSDTAIAQGIRYAADAGAQVINVSVGSDQAAPVLRDAIAYAVRQGAFVSIAAGNEFEDGNPVEYPAAYAAAIDGAVAVGAVGRSSRRASYSNTGSHLELVAPGGDVRDGGLAGTIYQVGPFPPDYTPGAVTRPRFDRFAEVPSQGTSMAAPHVSGVAALLHSQGITNPAAIEASMKAFATDLGSPGRDNEYGYGLIDPRASLRGMGLAR